MDDLIAEAVIFPFACEIADFSALSFSIVSAAASASFDTQDSFTFPQPESDIDALINAIDMYFTIFCIFYPFK